MNPCLLIPVYDHGLELGPLLESLESLSLPCIVVDDGSHCETRQALDRLAERFSWVRLERHLTNGGKGAALKTGYARAAAEGHSHVLQLDADGQHSASDVATLWVSARSEPSALVLGRPILENAPKARLYGRLISRFWVNVETCSRKIGDPLCGLRCMPLEATLRVLSSADCGDHMEFDPEIAVRLVWAGVPVVNVPCRVRYFPGGTSHFDMLRDNWRISRMHARLFFGMLLRLPRFLGSRLKEAHDRHR